MVNSQYSNFQTCLVGKSILTQRYNPSGYLPPMEGHHISSVENKGPSACPRSMFFLGGASTGCSLESTVGAVVWSRSSGIWSGMISTCLWRRLLVEGMMFSLLMKLGQIQSRGTCEFCVPPSLCVTGVGIISQRTSVLDFLGRPSLKIVVIDIFWSTSTTSTSV
jgi:hypothetical protein